MREQIEAAAHEANGGFVRGLPDGFDMQSEEIFLISLGNLLSYKSLTVGRLSLSGGQRQSLAIARALLKKPTILALEKVTSSLDASAERRVSVSRVIQEIC